MELNISNDFSSSFVKVGKNIPSGSYELTNVFTKCPELDGILFHSEIVRYELNRKESDGERMKQFVFLQNGLVFRVLSEQIL